MRPSCPVIIGLVAAALAGAPGVAGAATAGLHGGVEGGSGLAPTGARVVAYARKFTSVRYVFGANGPRSFDCSGYTSYVYRRFHVRLPRSSYAQMRQGRRVTGRLQPGDLVFWEGGGHVGIYTGNRQFISATVHRGIWNYSMSSWGRWQPYTTARRILPTRTSRSAGLAHLSASSFGFRGPRNGGPGSATFGTRR